MRINVSCHCSRRSASVPPANRNTSGFCSQLSSGTRPVPSISSCHQRISRSCCSGGASLSQAHISNFLNRKRALSLEGLDRVLASQNLTIDQILPLDLTAAQSPIPTQTRDPIEIGPVVAPTAPKPRPQRGPLGARAPPPPRRGPRRPPRPS